MHPLGKRCEWLSSIDCWYVGLVPFPGCVLPHCDGLVSPSKSHNMPSQNHSNGFWFEFQLLPFPSSSLLRLLARQRKMVLIILKNTRFNCFGWSRHEKMLTEIFHPPVHTLDSHSWRAGLCQELRAGLPCGWALTLGWCLPKCENRDCRITGGRLTPICTQTWCSDDRC